MSSRTVEKQFPSGRNNSLVQAQKNEKSNIKHDYLFKIVVTGDANSGKT
jgi:hypothetical protein